MAQSTVTVGQIAELEKALWPNMHARSLDIISCTLRIFSSHGGPGVCAGFVAGTQSVS